MLLDNSRGVCCSVHPFLLLFRLRAGTTLKGNQYNEHGSRLPSYLSSPLRVLLLYLNLSAKKTLELRSKTCARRAVSRQHLKIIDKEISNAR